MIRHWCKGNLKYWRILIQTIFQYVWDPEYLLSPTTGPAKQERAAMEEVFPINYDYFQVGRHYWHCLNNHHHHHCHLQHYCFHQIDSNSLNEWQHRYFCLEYLQCMICDYLVIGLCLAFNHRRPTFICNILHMVNNIVLNDIFSQHLLPKSGV